MSTYVNVSSHAIDTPTGELVAPGATVELDDELAAALVEQGALAELAPAKKSAKKETSE